MVVIIAFVIPLRLAPLPALVDILNLRPGDPALRPALRFDDLRPLLIAQLRVARLLAHGAAQERQFFSIRLLAPQRAVGVLSHAPVAKVGDKPVWVGGVQAAVFFIKCLYLLLAPRAVVVRPRAPVPK